MVSNILGQWKSGLIISESKKGVNQMYKAKRVQHNHESKKDNVAMSGMYSSQY